MSFKCAHCSKTFASEHGLKVHKGMKHKKRTKQILKAAKVYNKSVKGRKRTKKYERSVKATKRKQKYEKSKKGKARKQKYYRKTVERKQEKQEEERKRKAQEEMEKAKQKWRNKGRLAVEEGRSDELQLVLNVLHFQEKFGSKDYFNETNQGLWELAKKNGEETFQEDLKFDGQMRNNYWYQQPGYAAGKRKHRLEEFKKYFKTL